MLGLIMRPKAKKINSKQYLFYIQQLLVLLQFHHMF